jgi:hypothetical protein
MKKRIMAIAVSVVAAATIVFVGFNSGGNGFGLPLLADGGSISGFQSVRTADFIASDFTSSSGSIVKNGNTFTYSGVTVENGSITFASGAKITNTVQPSTGTVTGRAFVGFSTTNLTYGEGATIQYGGMASATTWATMVGTGTQVGSVHHWEGSSSTTEFLPYMNTATLDFTAGVAAFTVSALSFSYECDITANGAMSLVTNPTSGTTLAVGVGESSTVTANWTNADINTTYAWESGDTAIFTVSDGVVTGQAVGTSTLTLTSVNGGFTQVRTWPVVVGARLSGVVSDVNGPVSGATVAIKDTAYTTTTDASGAYAFTGMSISGSSYNVEVSKTGYISQSIANATTNTTLNISLVLNPVSSGRWATDFSNWNTAITRDESKFMFTLDSTAAFTYDASVEHTVSIFLTFGTAATARDGSTTIELKFNANNWIGVWNYKTSAWATWTSDVAYSLSTTGAISTANVSVTYAYINGLAGFSATKTDEIGISFGEWDGSTTAKWEGWGYSTFGFVDPALPNHYIRYTSTNTLVIPTV